MRRVTSRTAALAATALAVTLLPQAATPVAAEATGTSAGVAVPTLTVSTVASGLDHPWDVAALPDGSLLVTERERARLSRVVDGVTRQVAFPSGSVWVSGETGLMSLAVDPGFASNRRFYTCQGGFDRRAASRHDVRVVAWRLSKDSTAATQSGVLVRMPASRGRHGGCRLLVAPDGALAVGTGDAAVASNPRNLRSLGGKVLRVNRMTGAPAPGNPWPRAANANRRKIFTFGHRNVQGLAVRDGELWSVEQGTFRDDEVNRLVKGGDYGWQPGRGYDESRPMTDQTLPGRQIEAKWRSGGSTIATSGATFVQGARWGDLDGTLAVAALKGQQVLFLRFGADDALQSVTVPSELTRFGRLRSVTQLPGGGDLLVTTDNGNGQDRVLRISPTD